MRLSRRTTRHLICLTSLLAFVSTPLLAQTGIDLLDPEQIRRGIQSDEAATVRATSTEVPTGVIQATHQMDTLEYDDNGFENFEDDSTLRPRTETTQGLVEWAQRFEVPANGTLVSAFVCFYRPENDPSRSLDFKLRFYSDQLDGSERKPGRQGALTYTVEQDIRRPGTHTCARLRGHLVGKTLSKGNHWVAVEWDQRTRKRLGGDHYTADDQAEVDRSGMPLHDTEVRYRTLPVRENADKDGWMDPRQNRNNRSSGLKAIGIRLVVERTHPPDPTPTPDPDPEPDPTPTPDPDPGVILPPPTGAGFSACRPTVAPLTFEGGIKVSLCYDTMNGDMGDAEAVYGSDNSGLLYFFEPDNAEVFVKVLDGGCDQNDYRWVYMAALTDVAFNMYVNDGKNLPKAYHNRPGENHALVQDQMAFPCSR